MSLIYDDLWTGNINILFEMIADVNEAFSCLSAIRKKFYRSCTNTDYTIGESVPINPQRERLLLELAKCTSDDEIYLSSDIETNLKSSSPFINALSVLDRRVGKRRLQKIADRGSSVAPKWAWPFYEARFEAEGIKCAWNFNL